MTKSSSETARAEHFLSHLRRPSMQVLDSERHAEPTLEVARAALVQARRLRHAKLFAEAPELIDAPIAALERLDRHRKRERCRVDPLCQRPRHCSCLGAWATSLALD